MLKDYNEVLKLAKQKLKGFCEVCPECNGIACRGRVPGCGGKGNGDSFTICREFFRSVKINMDVVHEHYEADTKISLFGREFEQPFFAAPVGAIALNFGGIISEDEYVRAVTDGSLAAGGFAWTGDGPNEAYFEATLPVIKEAGGCGIATIKPWEQSKCLARLEAIAETQAMAAAMDLDSASLINLKLQGKPVFTKSKDEIAELAAAAGRPFIVKGVMTAEAAVRCAEAGCFGIVISSHGGRIIEDNPAPASQIRAVREATGDSLKIFVDGGIRTGGDVFKCLALGADAVLIGRPYAISAFGALSEGVRLFTEKIRAELKEAMLLTGAKSLSDIKPHMISCLQR